MTAPQPTAHVLCGSIPIRSIPAPLPRSNLALELVSAASEAPARPRSHAPYHTTRASAARTPQVAAALAARVARRRPSPVRRPLGFAWIRSRRRPSSVRRPLGFTWSAWSAGEATPSSLHRRQLPSDASPAVPPPSAARSQRQHASRSDVLGWPSPASRPAVSPLSVVRSSSFAMLASHCFLKCSQLYIFKLYHCEKSIQIH